MAAGYPSAVRLTAGTVLAERYRLTALLGQGGMGEVWAARHVLTGKAVAVKRLMCPADERRLGEARARFALEARSACAVEHPNVVEVFDFIQQDEQAPFIVMELLRGETLAARLARGPLGSASEVASCMLPVVSAVGTAHERGIVHRDLKPSNIFLDARPGDGGRLLVKVLDFGIAKWLIADPGEGALRTRTGSTLGTPSYMAPEQAIGDRSADHRVDVWSLGVILYEALSGVRPLEGDNAAQLVMRLLSTGIMPIEHLVPELPAELSALIGRMLSRDLARRPADLREVYQVLSALSGEESLRFGPPPPREGSALARADVPLPRAARGAPPGAPAPEPRGAWGAETALLETHSAIEMNTGPLPSGEALAGRGRRLRSVLAALLGSAAFIAGAALWLRPSEPSLGAAAPAAGRSVPATRASTPAASAPRSVPEVAGAPPSLTHDATHPPAADAAQPVASTSRPLPTSAARGARPAAATLAALPPTSAGARREAIRPKRPRTAAHGGTPARTRVAAPVASPAPAAQGRPPGSECERSSECLGGLCVAYTCQ
jgi:eukaryotic-like serine/threonine-protein kinase